MSESIIVKRINEVKGDLSQGDFATKIESSQPVVSKILGGDPPSMNFLLGISRAYNVSVDWLLGISSKKYLNGYSSYDDEKPLTYADVIGFLVKLMKENSISYERSEEVEDLYRSMLPDRFSPRVKYSDMLIIYDNYIGELLYAAHSLMKANPESIEAWLKKIVEDYDIPVLTWSESESTIFAVSRGLKTPLEILRDRLDSLTEEEE